MRLNRAGVCEASGVRGFKEVIVCKELLSTIREKLVAMQKYAEARKNIEETGLSNADEVLAHLRYKVTRKELDVNAATIS